MTPFLFIIITVLSILLFWLGTGKDNRFLLVFPAWLLLSGSLAFAGVFERHPLLFPLTMLGTVGLTIYQVKRSMHRVLHPGILVAVHVLRVPVELGLYQLYLQKQIPELMTFAGWNFDILTGISAFILLLYMLYGKTRISTRFFLAWNIMGLLFLFFIVIIAILSAPLPVQQFAFDQPNVAVLSFPYCLLPFGIVPVVLMSHVLLINQRKSNNINPKKS
jgi:hypothetical protein